MVLQPPRWVRQFVRNGTSFSMRVNLFERRIKREPAAMGNHLHSSDAPMFEPPLEARRRIPNRVGRNQTRKRQPARAPLYPAFRYAESCGDLVSGHQPILFE